LKPQRRIDVQFCFAAGGGLLAGAFAVSVDLEALSYRPHRVQAIAADLAKAISEWGADAVCAPLIDGAFVGLFVALD